MDEVFWFEILVRNGNMCAGGGFILNYLFTSFIYLIIFAYYVCINVMYTLLCYCFGEFLGYVYT